MLGEDEKEYAANPSWRHNGIIRNEESVDYPWTCQFCSKHKQFSALQECVKHCGTDPHQNALWWMYTDKGRTAPDVPQWSTPCAEGAAPGQTPNGGEGRRFPGETSQRAPQSESTPPAAGPRDRPSAASARTWTYTVSLHNAFFNDVRIDGAFLAVTIPCDIEPPPGANYEIDGARIYGDILPAHGSTARGPPPSLHLSQMGAGDLDEHVCVSSAMTMAQPEPASATFDASAQASSRQSTNGRLLPGMAVVFTNRPQPWTAYPKPPPPWPPRGAPAGAS